MKPGAICGLLLLLALSACVSPPPTALPVTPTIGPATTVVGPPTLTLPAPGSLRVYTDPAGATLWVDHTPVGQTPWEGVLSPGPHNLQLALPGYQRWMTETEMVLGAAQTVQVELRPFLSTPLPFASTRERREVRYLHWEPDGRGLNYALGGDIPSEEPKDWIWYRYEVATGRLEILPAPESRVDDETRSALGLCPLDRRQAMATPNCTATVLYESPGGSRMIYAPPELVEGPGGIPGWAGIFKLWCADVRGQEAIFLGDGTPSVEAQKPALVWSPTEDWVLIDVSYDAGVFYLARTDGTFFERLPLGGDVWVYLRILPRFSPDGRQLAFVGTTPDQAGRMSHATWVTTLADERYRTIKVSDRVGLLQWSADSGSLYILDMGYEGALYRVDLEEPFAERVIADGLPVCEWIRAEGYVYGLRSPGISRWALSPDESWIVYRAEGRNCGWVLLQIAGGE